MQTGTLAFQTAIAPVAEFPKERGLQNKPEVGDGIFAERDFVH
jgi:hypothetical protein